MSSRDWVEARARVASACLGLEAGWPGAASSWRAEPSARSRSGPSGHSAHCAGHEGRGASAISALAPLVAQLEGLSRPEEGGPCNVGVFHGGVARQVVPDAAELASTCGRRTLRRRGSYARCARSSRAPTDRGRIDAQRRDHPPGVPDAASQQLWQLARARAQELGTRSARQFAGRLGCEFRRSAWGPDTRRLGTDLSRLVCSRRAHRGGQPRRAGGADGAVDRRSRGSWKAQAQARTRETSTRRRSPWRERRRRASPGRPGSCTARRGSAARRSAHRGRSARTAGRGTRPGRRRRQTPSGSESARPACRGAARGSTPVRRGRGRRDPRGRRRPRAPNGRRTDRSTSPRASPA